MDTSKMNAQNMRKEAEKMAGKAAEKAEQMTGGHIPSSAMMRNNWPLYVDSNISLNKIIECGPQMSL